MLRLLRWPVGKAEERLRMIIWNHLPEAATMCLETTKMPKLRFAFDPELDQNGIPHQFCGFPLYWWTVKDLKKVEKS